MTLLFVLLIVTAIGIVLYSDSSQDYRFVKNEAARIQAEEIARSGIAYCRVHGVPPFVNGKPQGLKLFPEKNYSIEISKGVDTYRFTGTIGEGNQIRAQVSLFTPIWDLGDVRETP